MVATQACIDKFGNREDRTTQELIQIATHLQDDESIYCSTWFWPNIQMTILLDKQLEQEVLDVDIVARFGFHFKPYDNKGKFRGKDGIWHYSGHMSIHDLVACFGLDEQKIINPDPVPPGSWSGWYICGYRRQLPEV